MAAFECPTCHVWRSKVRGHDCNICWLLADLEAEHTAGSHKLQPQPSCVSCRPAQALRLPVINFDARPLTSLVYHDSAPQGRAQRPKTTSPRVAMSHAQCQHEKTPKARAKCRAERKVKGEPAMGTLKVKFDDGCKYKREGVTQATLDKEEQEIVDHHEKVHPTKKEDDDK